MEEKFFLLERQILIFRFEPYGCASYIVCYISKPQRGMSAHLDAAAKEARKGNFDLKKQIRHIENVFQTLNDHLFGKELFILFAASAFRKLSSIYVFSYFPFGFEGRIWDLIVSVPDHCLSFYSVEVSAQETVYLDMPVPLTKCTRDIVSSIPPPQKKRVYLQKPKSVMDELPAQSTDTESSNVIQRYSKRPKQLQKFCLADYISKVDVIYPKGDKLPEKFEEKKYDNNDASSSSDDNGNSLEDENAADDSHTSGLLYKSKNGARY